MTDRITSSELRFERLLDAPVETVWRYLTESGLRSRWFMGGSIEQRVGGAMEFVMDHDRLSDDDVPMPAKYAGVAGHRWSENVIEIDPPHLLVIGWEQGKAGTVRFELSAAGDRTWLLLIHSGLRGREDAADFGGGWHSHLATLARRLRGEPVPDFWEIHAASEAIVAAELGVERPSRSAPVKVDGANATARRLEPAMKMILLALAPLTLSGCLAKTAIDVVTLPVRAVGAGVDAVTTSQSEADRNRGRALRKQEEREAKEWRREEQRRRKLELDAPY